MRSIIATLRTILRRAYQYGADELMGEYIKDEILPSIDERLKELAHKIEKTNGDTDDIQEEYEEMFDKREEFEKLARSSFFDKTLETQARSSAQKRKVPNDKEDVAQLFLMKYLMGVDVRNMFDMEKEVQREIKKTKKFDFTKYLLKKHSELYEIKPRDLINLFSRVAQKGTVSMAQMIARNNHIKYEQKLYSQTYGDKESHRFEREDESAKTPQEELEEGAICKRSGMLEELLKDLKKYVHKRISKYRDKEARPVMEAIFDVWLDVIRKGERGGGWNEITTKITKDSNVKSKLDKADLSLSKSEVYDDDRIIHTYNRREIAKFVRDFFQKEMDKNEAECWKDALELHLRGVRRASEKQNRLRYLIAKYVLGKEGEINEDSFTDLEKMAKDIAIEQSKRKVAKELLEVASLLLKEE